ncbi:hypothetical protein MAR_004726 [Mya arenaria]|uniref:Transposase n=1 Tax=Mya arenaria TaxID=6604 RepID=A0ABY7F5M4_MYAAR|nr:hypothetical protein MAR_004726 [Mya arenaria]
MLPVPQFRWLMQLYIQDVLFRLDETKAEVTSIFGRILRMDSTKKIVGKLAGPVRGTALWASNIGNEYGQVLMSVLTAGEGHGLALMANGIMKRYKDAAVERPEVLFVDRDCCGSSPVRTLFHQWKDIPIRLDIWHFMRRMSGGCTTDSHPLYGSLMNNISRCIFMWDKDDLEALKEAKRGELMLKQVHLKDDADLLTHISKQELALHCRRTTRGADTTDSVVPDNLPGYAAVQDLAKHLVALVEGNLFLSSEQAAQTIQLWNALSPHDQRRTVFADRFDPQACHTFRAPKKTIDPGVQSTEWLVKI